MSKSSSARLGCVPRVAGPAPIRGDAQAPVVARDLAAFHFIGNDVLSGALPPRAYRN
jgi:hypothetical protein